MLHDFISSNREELIARTRAKAPAEPRPPSSVELELLHGVPRFLVQLSETLRLEMTSMPLSPTVIGATAAEHGRDLLAMGYTTSQVVHDYGDVCQAITELAFERRAAINTEEFHTLNRCLDIAIAEAVTGYVRLKEETTSHHDLERRGRLAHELRNLIQTAMLSFRVLKAGAVGTSGSTGAVLGRSLIAIRDFVDRDVAEVRLTATAKVRERIALRMFISEVSSAAQLHAEYRGIQFTVEPLDPTLAVDADPQLLASAVMNLLQNAFKYTHANGRVAIRVHAGNGRVFIDVEDECGGMGQGVTDLFRAFGDRHGSDRSGLGLGLSISSRAVAMDGGEIHTRNVPGKGCIFSIELPQASAQPLEPVSREPCRAPDQAQLPGGWPAMPSRAHDPTSMPR